MAMRDVSLYPASLRASIASLAVLGRLDQAREMLQTYRLNDPDANISSMKRLYRVYRRPEDVDKFLRAYRVAGLPE